MPCPGPFQTCSYAIKNYKNILTFRCEYSHFGKKCDLSKSVSKNLLVLGSHFHRFLPRALKFKMAWSYKNALFLFVYATESEEISIQVQKSLEL